MAVISMRCKDCNGLLDVNEDQTIMFCPYCGSKSLILENDAVQIERIKSEAQTKIELERIKSEEKKAQNPLKGIVIMVLAFIALAVVYVLLNKLIYL